MFPRISHLLLCGFALVTLTACNPLAWWRERPLHPNARVEAFTPEGKPRFVQEWRERKKHGTWKDFYPDGTLKDESSYDHGEKHGMWRSFYPNGKPKSEGAYDHGLESGPWAAWFENGQKSFEGNFTAGKRHGKFFTWNEQGRVVEDAEWKDGVNLTPPGKLAPNGSL